MSHTRRPLRLLHTSDLHLGDEAGVVPGHLARESLSPLLMVADAVCEANADMLLIAGDLFDSNRAEASLVLGAQRILAALPLPVVILPGNHDSLDASSVYLRFESWASLPSVRVLTRVAGETIDFPQLQLRVWGRPTVDHLPATRPLEAVPTRSGEGWYVVAGHGHYTEPPGRGPLVPIRSSPILRADIDGLDADYVALGHRDRSERIAIAHIEAWYSGAPVISGHIGSALLVELASGGIHVKEWPLRPPSSGAHNRDGSRQACRA